MVEFSQRQDPTLPGIAAPFQTFSGSLGGIAVSSSNEIFVADRGSHVIWKIGTNGYTSVTAGQATIAECLDGPCTIGNYDGNGALTGHEHFDSPSSISMDARGRLLVADAGNSAVRLLTPRESLITVAGQRLCCYGEEGIPAAEATFHWPRGLASDRDGNIYVADPKAGRVRKIDLAGRITTILGNGSRLAREANSGSDTGAQPYSVAVDSKGVIYVAEPGLAMIRRITSNGFVQTVVGPRSGEFPLTLPTRPSRAGAVAVGPRDELYYLADCNVFR